MITKQIPRVLFAGTHSGCGKTTVTCAVLQALADRGLRTAAFKCGPDYIDPMFHSRIIGAKSANLDLFFLGENSLRFLLQKNADGCDVAVIEGVMGYYDGLGLTTMQASTYEVAQASDSPVVLVVNARGASLSTLAVIQGFLRFCPGSRIRGVVLNQCSAMAYAALADAIRAHFGGEVQPLGYLPRLEACALESRHLGLVTADEVADLKTKMHLLAAQAEKTLDLDGILRLAAQAEPVCCTPVTPRRFAEPVRIAVARDKAFCFYYEDNLDLLREMGAQLVAFSPLADARLPENIHGLYLGGGYPELYAGALSANRSMRKSVYSALAGRLPCIAECGGFMYLTQDIGGQPMAGFLPGSCRDTGRLARFGYARLRAKQDNLLCRAGEELRAHEFHHWDCSCPGADFAAAKLSGKSWDCCTATEFLYAGYPHLHFYADPALAEHFYEACLKEKHCHDRNDTADGHREAKL